MRVAAVLCLLVLARCGASQDAPAPRDDSKQTSQTPLEAGHAEDTTQAFVTTGLELVFYANDGLAGSAEQEPALEVRAERAEQVQMSSAGNAEETRYVYNLEKPEFTIHGRKEGEEDTHLVAARGWFDTETREGAMDGSVVLTRGTLTIAFEDVAWSDAERSALSEKPVIITNGETRLEAGSIKYLVDTEEMFLNGFRGEINVQETAAELEKAGAQS